MAGEFALGLMKGLAEQRKRKQEQQDKLEALKQEMQLKSQMSAGGRYNEQTGQWEQPPPFTPPVGFEPTKFDVRGRPTYTKTKPTTKEISPSTALTMLSDPFKSREMKRVYPKLHLQLEKIVKDAYGQDILGKSVTNNKTTETDIANTNW